MDTDRHSSMSPAGGRQTDRSRRGEPASGGSSPDPASAAPGVSEAAAPPSAGFAEVDATALRRFFDLSADLFVVAAKDGTVRHANPAWRRVLGYPPEEVAGRKFFEFVVAADLEVTRAALSRVLEDGRLEGFENRYVRADGAERTIQWTVQADAATGAVYGVGRDTTVRRSVESALAESRALYKTLFDASMDGILVTDPDGAIHMANPAMRGMLGYPRDGNEVLHRDTVVDRDDPRLAAALAERAATGSFFGELTFVRADGSRFPVELSTVLFRDAAGRERTSMVVRDVSDRRRLQGALRDANRRAQLQAAAMDASANAIAITDRAGVIEWVNPAFTTMTGYAQDEAVGQTMRLLRSGRQSAAYYAEMWRTILEGEAWRGEMVNRRKDGGLYTQEQTITPVEGEDGRISHFVSVMQDVSARARSRERIEALNTRLEAQLTRTQSLHRVDTAILQEGPLGSALDAVLDEAARALDIDAATLFRVEAGTASLGPMLERGMPLPAPRLRFGEGIAGTAAASRERVLVRDTEAEPDRDVTRLREYGLRGALALPLISMGRLEGVLSLFTEEPLRLDDDALVFAESIARQAALAIQRDTLVSGLQGARDELQEAYDRTIEGWARALDLKDEETAGHSQRVTELTLALAERLGVPAAQRQHIRRGALLHDMGKMGVPDAILRKPGRLTAEEFEAIQRHPVYAYEMLKDIAFLRPALAIPRHHHERWDGGGYPDGLVGEAIPLAARIFAVVDVFDALTSARPYRDAWSPMAALAHIEEHAGSHFDPRVVAAFVEMTLEGDGVGPR